jgi:transcription initiation factor TFIIIB Brf1 subunit/transcription initiation factor TFIIB
LDNVCPECNGELLYEVSTKHFICKKCGLYATREQLYDIKDRLRPQRKRSKESEYLEWWMNREK